MNLRSIALAAAIAAVPVLAAPASSTATAHAAPAAADVRAASVADVPAARLAPATAARAVIVLLNVERRSRGLKPLRSNVMLHRAAAKYVREMVRGGFFAHTSPSRSTVGSRLRDARSVPSSRRGVVGENLAHGTLGSSTPRATVRAWMNSRGHRANVLHPRFRRVGIGIAAGTPTGAANGATVAAVFAG
jgi:uncharacterized protein YkwD